MKNILVPIDFSDPSKNAAEYAIELAKHTDGKITFLHVYPMPTVATEMPVLLSSYDEIEHDSLNLLKNLAEELRAKLNYKPAIECLTGPGYLLETTKDIVKEKAIDLIVMGITGGGVVTEKLIGSNATVIIKNLNCSTIVVPLGASFKQLATIAFATDFENIENSTAIKEIKTVCETFNSKLRIVNVIHPHQILSYDKSLSGMILDGIFEKIDHSIHLPEGELADGINKVIDEQKADILIMIPRRHVVFSEMIAERHTKKMAFHTHIPLLTIHEK